MFSIVGRFHSLNLQSIKNNNRLGEKITIDRYIPFRSGRGAGNRKRAGLEEKKKGKRFDIMNPRTEIFPDNRESKRSDDCYKFRADSRL